MTNEEKWAIQGRARDELSNLKSESATYRAKIEQHVQDLNEIVHVLVHILSHPTDHGHNFSLVPTDLHQTCEKLSKVSARIKELEQIIANF